MKSKTDGTTHMIILERGEEVVTAIAAYCKREHIMAAHFSGIGAVELVKIGYYDLEHKEYIFKSEQGVFEVASMTGNVAEVDGQPFVHVHAVLSRCDDTLACIGAHLKEAFVAVTLEVVLTTMSCMLSRRTDDDIGLKLISL